MCLSSIEVIHICSLEIELALAGLALLEEFLSHLVNVLARCILLHVLNQTSHWVPVLIALVLLLHILEVNE